MQAIAYSGDVPFLDMRLLLSYWCCAASIDVYYPYNLANGSKVEAQPLLVVPVLVPKDVYLES